MSDHGNMNLTDKVRDVQSVGETAGGASSGIIDPIRPIVCTSCCSQVVVVPIIDQ